MVDAERIRRAEIVTADGFREMTKTKAEGAMQSQVAVASGESRVAVLRAKGISDARKLIADAEAQAVSLISTALSEYGVSATDYLVGMHHIEAFTEIAINSKDRTIFFPMESDVVGALANTVM